MYELTAEDTELIRRVTEEDLPALAAQLARKLATQIQCDPLVMEDFMAELVEEVKECRLRRVAMFAQLQPLHARFLRFREPGVLVRGLFRFRA